MAALRLVTLATVASLFGCGDAMVDQGYRAEPQVTFPTTLLINAPPDHNLLRGTDSFHVALHWAPAGATYVDPSVLLEQASTQHLATLRRSFDYHLFDRPPEAAFQESAGGGRFAIATVLSYFDANDNGRRDADETIIGTTDAQALLFTDSALAPEVSPTGRPLPPGYHLVRLPLPTLCRPLPRPTPGRPCDVPLGIACERDEDCGRGVCLSTETTYWTGGACAAPIPTGCDPAVHGFFFATGRPGGYVIKGCRSNADCERPGEDAYRCDLGAGGCVPASSLVVWVGRRPLGKVFCGLPARDVKVGPEGRVIP